jgi:two-component system, NarL family, sensor kinase
LYYIQDMKLLNKKIAAILIIQIFFVTNCYTQTANNRDSLIKVVSAAKQDTSTVITMLKIAVTYENNEPATAIQYGRQAMRLSKKIGYTTGEINALRAIAEYFNKQGSFDSALFHYREALRQSRNTGDTLKAGMTLFSIGATYRYMNDYQEAVDYSMQAVKVLEQSGDRKLVAKMNNGLQLLYYSLANYDAAITYGEKAVQQSRDLKDTGLLIKSLSNLSMPYKDKKQLEKSKDILMEALALMKGRDDIYSESAILINLAGVFLEQGQYELLKEYSERSLQMSRKINSKDGECISLRGLAISYLQSKNYVLAKQFAEQAYSIADSNNYKYEKASCLKTLSNISYAMGDLKAGEKYYNQSDDLFEDIFKEAHQESAAKYEKKYESEKKDKQLILQQAQLQKRRIVNYILFGSAAALLIVSLLSYRNYKQKQKLQQQRIAELETEKQLTATEAVLKGEEQERTRLAKDLHDGLGGMLSGIKYSFQTMKGNLVMTPENNQAFERSIDMLDSSIKEMRRVAHNMMPEALVKFGLDTALKDFCNDINQSGALQVSYQSIGLENEVIEQTTAITIYRIVQELINNTMKHAAAKTAIVQVTRSGDQLAITVEDDGKGFDTSMLALSKGIGWSNIQNRVDFLKGTLDVRSEKEKGTSVHIELNI